MRELQQVKGEASREYLIGVGYWLRCLESCQGAVLLIERGLPSAPFPILRTAFECLFFASALWRKPALSAKLEAGHHAERIKQAQALLAAGAASRVPAAGLADLQAVAAEPVPAGKVSHCRRKAKSSRGRTMVSSVCSRPGGPENAIRSTNA